ncbi:MAG: HNH endonuclease [Syntrophobacteraceae bacterium]
MHDRRCTPPLRGFLPEQPPRTYSPVDQCIYCGSTAGLSNEHIIPLGLGGRLVLPKASCAKCGEATSKIERTCLRTMYGALRLLYDLPTRRKGNRPKTLPLKVKRTEEDDWEYTPVEQEIFPFLITFPQFDLPGAITGAVEASAPGPVTKRLWIRGASPSNNFMDLLDQLTLNLGVHSIMPESKADVPSFCSLLAKIGHAFMVAETRLLSFSSPLARYATGSDLSHCLYYIGSHPQDEPPSYSLHELSFVEPLPDGSRVVRIRLLARLGTPTYFVVFGKPEGSP